MILTPSQMEDVTGTSASSSGYSAGDFATDLGDFFGWGSARRQREWQTYLSNTAHQREVADLKAAGLNPALSVTGGTGGASTPGGTNGNSTSSNILPQTIQATSNLINTIDKIDHKNDKINAITSAVKVATMLAKFI